jgi:hypothetical protein
MAMGRPHKEVKALQMRFSVPSEDVIVTQWIKKQYNLSGSIRALIKDVAKQHGYIDYTCIDSEEVVDIPENTYIARPPARQISPYENESVYTAQPTVFTQPEVKTAAYTQPVIPQPVAETAPQQFVTPLTPVPAYVPQPTQVAPVLQNADNAATLASLLG